MQQKKWLMVCLAVSLGCITLIFSSTILAHFIGLSGVVVEWAVWEYGTPGLILLLVLLVYLFHTNKRDA